MKRRLYCCHGVAFTSKQVETGFIKVSADGSKAYKVDIQLGRQNPDYYEVLQGLQPR